MNDFLYINGMECLCKPSPTIKYSELLVKHRTETAHQIKKKNKTETGTVQRKNCSVISREMKIDDFVFFRMKNVYKFEVCVCVCCVFIPQSHSIFSFQAKQYFPHNSGDVFCSRRLCFIHSSMKSLQR